MKWFVGTCCLAVIACAALIFVPNLIPQELENNVEPTIVPITSTVTDDAKDVQIVVGGGNLREIKSYTDGIVTDVSFSSGSNIKSGDVVLEINNHPVVVQYAPKPIIDNLETTLWIPQESVRLQRMLVEVGDYVNMQQTVFSILSPLTEAEITYIPEDVLPGERVLDLGDQKIELEADYQIPKKTLNKVLGSEVYISALRNFINESSADNSSAQTFTSFNAKILLVQPVEAFSVPPSSILIDANNHTCVFLNQVAHPISIVGSSLGASLVSFTETTLDGVDYRPPEGVTCK
jgi:multidrug efflux pump subunit AcrA (membrane-fusion protein)